MPIYDQGYQNWHGTLTGHATRWVAITRQGALTQWRNRRVKYLLFSALAPAVALVVVLAFWGMFEQKSDFIKPILDLLSFLPEEIREGPRGYRTAIWTLVFNVYLSIELFLSLLLTLIVGPDLISQDLRFNAFPLYLSRPMRRFDYFLGKLGVIAAFVGGVTVLPVVLAYVVGVAFSLDVTVLRDTWRILAASVIYGVIVSVVCGLVMLAFSSLSRNSRVVASMWVGLWFLTGMVAGAVIGASSAGRGEPTEESMKWTALSFPANLDRVREAMLDTDAAYDHISMAWVKQMEVVRQAQAAMQSRGSGPGGAIGRIFRPRPPVDIQLDSDTPQPSPPPEFLKTFKSHFPWEWSAGILTGLCVVSIFILSTRVKSLDRLR